MLAPYAVKIKDDVPSFVRFVETVTHDEPMIHAQVLNMIETNQKFYLKIYGAAYAYGLLVSEAMLFDMGAGNVLWGHMVAMKYGPIGANQDVGGEWSGHIYILKIDQSTGNAVGWFDFTDENTLNRRRVK